ncbi:nucleoside-diphosphate-sugar epimerase [Diaminobutyricimonas aerilata]|uniref:Nucleoside-diphosphate-sugar epimerase n=1 Tax=Diaminobutyricimonas aerilata TaxID=1162967 RepID=A0A2M9CI43_9MICO|nr:NAD-dependent epimerase/dehydratase family protein [Diaminobutyricimonas aerilata]PJJ71540.1 nucleoside-diphosphate-sugar epimerase [Diaminobutyricimonas aerilata]
MRILLLGGTAWLGSHIARDAIARGHDVTALARGSSGMAPNGVRFVTADRDDPAAYEGVAGERWDAVIDVSRQPGHVRGALAALSDRTEHWVFVSTGSVYARDDRPGDDETAERLEPLAGDTMHDMSQYGPAKVACENTVLAARGDGGALIARAGLIGGPGDGSGRTGYWPRRFARPSNAEGRVLVPDAPRLSTQVIDVRDLASWLVDAAERRIAGTMNAYGDATPFAEHLRLAREVAGHDGEVVAVAPTWLAEHGVEAWMGPRSLPIWLPEPEYSGHSARDVTRSRSAGLRPRPLVETLADTLAWESSDAGAWPRRAGLTDDEERELLAAV